jgi:hypothetical protein
MTICAWIKTTDAGRTSRIIEHEDNFYLWQESGKFYFTVHGSSSQAVSTSAPVADIWQHVLVTYKANQPARIYINGVWESESSTALVMMPDNTQTFQIGARRSSSSTTPSIEFSGDLDDVAIWQGILSSAEIEALAGRNMGGYAGRTVPSAIDNLAVITTGHATDICKTSATLTGMLLSKSVVSNQVSVYWGRNDGAADTNQWTNCLLLGTPEAGALQTNLTDLIAGVTYFYRFHAANLSGQYWATNSASFSTWRFQPDDISDLKLWLRADIAACINTSGVEAGDGDTIVQWNDQSGNNNHATSIGISGNITLVEGAVNNQPMLAFTDLDGGDYLRVAGYQPVDTNNLTVFVVSRAAVQTLNGSSIHPLVGSGDPAYGKSAFTITTLRPNAGGAAVLGYFGRFYNPYPYDEYTKATDIPNFSDGEPHIIELQLSGVADGGTGSFTGYYDGVMKEMHEGVNSNPLNGPVEIGGSASSSNRRYAGAFGEILIYDRALTTIERNEAGWFLQEKYGIEGEYIKISGATLMLIK